MSTFIDLKSFNDHYLNKVEISKIESGHFNIIRVEDISVSGSKPVSFTRRSYFKVSIVTGHSLIHYADQCIEVLQNALVFTNPMIPYYWEPLSEKQTGLICIFTNEFLGRFANIGDYPVFHFSGNSVISLTEEQKIKFHDAFLRMSSELAGDYRYKYDLLRCLLLELIHEAQKMKPVNGVPLLHSNANERITQLFSELLERQFPIELSSQTINLKSPNDFARQLNIHINHLNKALKEITGDTTSAIIGKRVVQEAKVLLKTTSWSINEIAWSLGFEEPNHFSSFFKRNTGLTPKQLKISSID